MVAENSIEFECKSIDETKAAVHGGLIEPQITEFTSIFGLPPVASDEKKPSVTASDLAVPIIDFAMSREGTVEKIKEASEKWGIFQVINHGVPTSVLEEIKDGVVRFHEEDPEVKKTYFSRDFAKTFIYHNNFELYSSSAGNWRDSFACYMAPNPPNPEDIPVACR